MKKEQQHNSLSHLTYRSIQEDDWPSIMKIQEHAYVEIEPESLSVLRSRVRLSPDTCWVAMRHGTLVGYCLAHPWKGQVPPALHETLHRLPMDADILYIHDVALVNTARGLGCGTGLVNKAFAAACQKKICKSALVAVQGAAAFWQKIGYHPVPLTSRTALDALKKYGQHAQYMEMTY